MTYDQQGRRVLHGHPSTWQQEVEQLRAENQELALQTLSSEGQAATAYAEVMALKAQVQELEQTVDGIWRYAVDTTVSDHHFRGWVEVEARAALQKQDGFDL